MQCPENRQPGARRRPLTPYRLLFPLAALFALAAVPLWLLLSVTHPAMTGTTWHGHEMVFGFALAVIAGFLATRPARAATWILAGTWLAARIAAATGSGPLAFNTRRTAWVYLAGGSRME